jgi:hypothetical protein
LFLRSASFGGNSSSNALLRSNTSTDNPVTSRNDTAV